MKANFLALRQGNITVVEYERRFTELSHYAMEFIFTEANQAKRFEQALRPAIREKLVALKIRDYGDVVDRATLVERDIEDWARGGPIRTGASSSGVRRAAPHRLLDQTVGPRPQLARGAGGVPVGAGIDSRSYFACGGAGHIRMHCPIYPPQRNTQTAGSVQVIRPPPLRPLPQQRTLGARAPSDAIQGRVFALTQS